MGSEEASLIAIAVITVVILILIFIGGILLVITMKKRQQKAIEEARQKAEELHEQEKQKYKDELRKKELQEQEQKLEEEKLKEKDEKKHKSKKKHKKKSKKSKKKKKKKKHSSDDDSSSTGGDSAQRRNWNKFFAGGLYPPILSEWGRGYLQSPPGSYLPPNMQLMPPLIAPNYYPSQQMLQPPSHQLSQQQQPQELCYCNNPNAPYPENATSYCNSPHSSLSRPVPTNNICHKDAITITITSDDQNPQVLSIEDTSIVQELTSPDCHRQQQLQYNYHIPQYNYLPLPQPQLTQLALPPCNNYYYQNQQTHHNGNWLQKMFKHPPTNQSYSNKQHHSQKSKIKDEFFHNFFKNSTNKLLEDPDHSLNSKNEPERPAPGIAKPKKQFQSQDGSYNNPNIPSVSNIPSNLSQNHHQQEFQEPIGIKRISKKYIKQSAYDAQLSDDNEII